MLIDYSVIVICDCVTAPQGMKNCEINWLRLYNSLLIDYSVIVICDCVTALQGMKNCEINWLRLYNSLLMVQCNTMFIMIVRCILRKKDVWMHQLCSHNQMTYLLELTWTLLWLICLVHCPRFYYPVEFL